MLNNFIIRYILITMRSWKKLSVMHTTLYRKNSIWMKEMFIAHYRLKNIVKCTMLTMQAIPFAAPNPCILQNIQEKEISILRDGSVYLKLFER